MRVILRVVEKALLAAMVGALMCGSVFVSGGAASSSRRDQRLADAFRIAWYDDQWQDTGVGGPLGGSAFTVERRILTNAASRAETATTPSPSGFVTYLAREPITLPAGFTVAGSPIGYVRRPLARGRPQPPPMAVGVVVIGAASQCCRGTQQIQYTVYPDARTAREWMFGHGAKPVLSIWRLKQLSGASLPHPRLAGRLSGYPTTSVIVESAGHLRIDRKGTTEADVLVGNVIANVTTSSDTSTQHGNRVAASQLIKAAVAHLRRAQSTFQATR
jgi:hypothetical protein